MSDYEAEFYGGVPEVSTARSVAVESGQLAVGIDADLLALPVSTGLPEGPSDDGASGLRDWSDSAAMPSGAGHITGTVTADDTGVPVAGICVFAYTEDESSYGSATTGADGSYDVAGLSAGEHVVYFEDCTGPATYFNEYFDDAEYDSDAEPVVVTSGETTAGIDAGLRPGGHITGTVTADDTGLPLEGICIQAGAVYAETSPDGFYDLGPVVAENLVRFFDCNGSGQYVNEFFDDTVSSWLATPVAVTPRDTISDIDAGLAVASHITGTVTADDTGLPLENICVSAYGDSFVRSGYTEADGSYDVGGLTAGTYTVQFEDCETGDYAYEYFDDVADPDSATPITVAAQSTTAGIDAGLAHMVSISGSVTADDTDLPLESVCVWISVVTDTGTNPVGFAYTRADGTYQVRGLGVGAYQVFFNPDCTGTYDYVAEYYDDVVDSDAATLLQATPGDAISGIDAGIATGGHITGTVIADDTGLPLDDVCVYAYDTAHNDWRGFAQTGPDGTYDMGRLVAGNHRLSFRECSFAGQYTPEYFDDVVDYEAATAVPVSAGGTTSGIDAGLARAGHISGAVTAEDTGLPLEDVCVSVQSEADYASWGYASTGPDGAYDVGGLVAGSYRVRFDYCGSGDYAYEYFDDVADPDEATPVVVTTGETTSGVDAGLAVGAHITGTVTADDTGLPLAGIRVYATTGTPPPIHENGEPSAYTEADGSYDIGRLHSGNYTITFADSHFISTYAFEHYDDETDYGAATPVSVAAGGLRSGIDASLARSAHISGTVTESGSGTPISGAWVAVLRTDDFSIVAGAPTWDSGQFIAEVRPGSYFLYVVDPSGGHTAGFHGAPATVTVTAGATTDADPQMASLRGSVAGTVTEAGSGAPIGGAWVIGINATTGATQRGAVANGSGQYSIAGLTPGSYRPVFVDPTGAHGSRYFPNSVDFLGATSLAVTAGGSTAANVALPAQSTTPGAQTLSGTVREAGSNAPLGGVFVVALRASDFRNAGGAVTNGSGQYALNVAAGDYKLAFIDSTGGHNMEWHDNQPNTGLATATSVTAPAVTNAALDANTGTLAGAITDDPSGNPLAGAWVIAIGPSGAIAGGAVTDWDGTYTIAGLAPGTYRATIVDPNGGRRQEYYNNSPDYAGATPINITAGATATVNAALALP